MEHTIKNFWNWFEANNQAYLFINEVEEAERDRLMDAIGSELHKYNENLWIEIGGFANEVMELIVTAEGDTEFFNMVEDVVAQAPDIKGWNFVAFLPPMVGDPFKINYEGVELDTEDMWFLPLEEEDDPKSIGLRICTPNFDEIKDHEYFMSAIYKILETLLGEKTFALDIDYVETGEVPENPEEEGMMELQEVLEYVEWEKKNRHLE
jgi:hypothetical protein